MGLDETQEAQNREPQGTTFYSPAAKCGEEQI
jgi:hypothetical protein